MTLAKSIDSTPAHPAGAQFRDQCLLHDARRWRGFTLIELFVTLGILALLVSIAMPSWSGLFTKQRHQTDVADMLSAFHLARLTAVQEQQLITLCAGDPATGCTSHWQKGLLVLADHPDNPFDPNKVLFTYTPPAGSVWKGNVARFVFSEAGTLSGQSGSLLLCSEQAEQAFAQRLVISRGGRLRIEQSATPQEARLLCAQSWAY